MFIWFWVLLIRAISFMRMPYTNEYDDLKEEEEETITTTAKSNVDDNFVNS